MADGDALVPLRVKVLRVPREKVVRAAQSAIEETRREGHVVETGVVRRLMRVARSAPEFALGSWYVKERCGCLVGNLLGPKDVEHCGDALYRVGLNFDADISELLTARQEDAAFRHVGPVVLRVVD